MTTDPTNWTLSGGRGLLRNGVRLWAPAAMGLALGASAAFQTLAAADAKEPTLERAPEQLGVKHTIGMDRLVAISLEPTKQSTNGNGRDEVEYEIVVSPSEQLPTAVRLSYEIVTPEGELAASVKNPVVMTPGRGHRTKIKTPRDLSDGYYTLRVGAAASNDLGTDADLAEAYLHMEGGQLALLTFEEWSEQSGVNVARIIVSDFQPANEEEAREHFAATPADEPQGDFEPAP
ncbi:MAG: hypothetical protein OXU20_40040 [Myxococcales bacterium]|nr:hypothetical protein [Myxococcales bacterium]